MDVVTRLSDRPLTLARWAAAAAGIAAGAYVATVTWQWLHYGTPAAPQPDEADPLLDGVMPHYEVAERHHIRVAAPAEVVLEAATQADLQGGALVRAIFVARERLLGARSAARVPRGLLDEVQALGWRKLAEVPGRELVMGAVTQPWHAAVVFRPLAPAAFMAFAEPAFVKIAWTLRADPLDPDTTIFRTETRVMTTDAEARRRFRWYWARFSPGILIIRRLLLAAVKRDAERRQTSSVTPVRPPARPPCKRAGSMDPGSR